MEWSRRDALGGIGAGGVPAAMAAAKKPQEGMVRAAAIAYAHEGPGVAPGPIRTPLQARSGASELKLKSFGGGNTPMGRPGRPAELASIYVQLAAADASYATLAKLHFQALLLIFEDEIDYFAKGHAILRDDQS
jgi:NAD(P)-dependent dehydrogenase (short-subunit alcohol dehydrogenase family)